MAEASPLKAIVVGEPHLNPAPQHREMWLRDPDGYVFVIASPDGEATRARDRRAVLRELSRLTQEFGGYDAELK